VVPDAHTPISGSTGGGESSRKSKETRLALEHSRRMALSRRFKATCGGGIAQNKAINKAPPPGDPRCKVVLRRSGIISAVSCRNSVRSAQACIEIHADPSHFHFRIRITCLNCARCVQFPWRIVRVNQAFGGNLHNLNNGSMRNFRLVKIDWVRRSLYSTYSPQINAAGWNDSDKARSIGSQARRVSAHGAPAEQYAEPSKYWRYSAVSIDDRVF
jgi:hypothetical protein